MQPPYRSIVASLALLALVGCEATETSQPVLASETVIVSGSPTVLNAAVSDFAATTPAPIEVSTQVKLRPAAGAVTLGNGWLVGVRDIATEAACPDPTEFCATENPSRLFVELDVETPLGLYDVTLGVAGGAGPIRHRDQIWLYRAVTTAIEGQTLLFSGLVFDQAVTTFVTSFDLVRVSLGVVPGTLLQIEVGQSAAVAGTGAQLAVTAVNDSRCPSNCDLSIQCVWQGEARLQLLLSDDRGEQSLELVMGGAGIALGDQTLSAIHMTRACDPANYVTFWIR